MISTAYEDRSLATRKCSIHKFSIESDCMMNKLEGCWDHWCSLWRFWSCLRRLFGSELFCITKWIIELSPWRVSDEPPPTRVTAWDVMWHCLTPVGFNSRTEVYCCLENFFPHVLAHYFIVQLCEFNNFYIIYFLKFVLHPFPYGYVYTKKDFPTHHSCQKNPEAMLPQASRSKQCWMIMKSN